ncbi:Cell division protein FtsH [Levilactobacillus brevis]|nr:Cell division protein FtsH [Levilactobacillus brevis]
MNNRRNGLFRNSLFYIVIFLLVIGVVYLFNGNNTSSQSQEIQSSQFVKDLNANKIKNFSIQPSGGVYKITGEYRNAQKRATNTGFSLGGSQSTAVTSFSTQVLTNNSTVSAIDKAAKNHNVKVNTKAEESSGFWINLLVYVAPLLIFFFFFYMMMGQAGQGGGNGRVMNFGKSKAKPADSKENKVRFSDVAGEEEEKQNWSKWSSS